MSPSKCQASYLITLLFALGCILASPKSEAKRPVPFAYFNLLPADGVGENSCAIDLDLEQKLEQQTRQGIIAYQNELIQKRVGPRSGDEDKWEFLKRHPLDAALLLIPHDLIFLIEKRYFHLDETNGDGEGDAFRHFMSVAVFTHIVGIKKARAYMKFHEQGDISMSSLMDRYNNLVAFSIVEREFAKKRIFPLRGIIKLGIQAVKSGQLYVLSPVGYPARSEKVIALSEARFKKWANNYLRYFIEE